MPKIPEYDPQAQMSPKAPADLVDAQSYGVGYRTAAKLTEDAANASALSWQSVGKLGTSLENVGLELNKSMYHAKQITDLANATSSSRMQLYDLGDQIRQQNPDPETWPTAFKEQGQKIYDDSMANIPDKLVQAHFQDHWSTMFPTLYHGMLNQARQEKISQFAGNIESQYANSLELYNKAGSDLERAQIKGNLFGLINGGVKSGIILPAKAQRFMQGFDTQVGLNNAQADARTDPFAFKTNIEQYGLDEKDRANLTNFADHNIAKLQQDNYQKYMTGILGSVDPNSNVPTSLRIWAR